MGWEDPGKEDIPAEPDNIPVEPDNIPAEPDNTAEEAYVAVSEEAFPSESCIIAEQEEPLPADAPSPEPPVGMGNFAHDTMREASQAEPTTEGFDDMDEHPWNREDQLREPMPEPDPPPVPTEPVEYDEGFTSTRSARNTEPQKFKFCPPSPSGPSSVVTSVLESTAPLPPAENSHTITLKILTGDKTFRSIVFIKSCTRTAILNEARAYCAKCAAQDDRDNNSVGTLLRNGGEMTLVSLKMYGCDMDLSTYQVENLSSLVRTVEKTGIPRFTLRICEV